MSYRLSYSGTIYVSGSRSVSYPASEHGGTMTVNFTEAEPVYIDVYVDTDAFDASVDNAAEEVDDLTRTVGAFQTAQIASIKSNAQKISDRLINGFYHLIGNDISTKKAENKTVIQSKFALLMEYSKAMADTKDRMESDTARMYQHYSAIFKDLDADLEKRIKEMDRRSFQLTEGVRDRLILNMAKEDISSCFDETKQAGKMNGLISSARLRKAVSGILTGMKGYLTNSLNFTNTISEIAHQEKLEAVEEEYIPSLYYETSGLGDTEDFRVFHMTPPVPEQELVESAVDDAIAQSYDDEWDVLSEEETGLIEQAFMQHMEEDFMNSQEDSEFRNRVANVMQDLFQQNKNEMLQLIQHR